MSEREVSLWLTGILNEYWYTCVSLEAVRHIFAFSVLKKMSVFQFTIIVSVYAHIYMLKQLFLT